MSGVHILIPAAGASQRMRGADKLLEPVDGVALLRRTVEAARRSGATKVWVTLPPGDRVRNAVLDGSWAKRIVIPDWEEGMAASLRAGARAIAAMKASAVLVLLADLPEIEAEDLARFVEAHAKEPDVVWRGTAEEGREGHPVLIPARLFLAFAGLTGDAGARSLLDGETVTPIALPGNRATTDLDTPEAWAAWRARTGR